MQTSVGALEVRVVGAGPTAVLWHSLFLDSRSWWRVEEALAAQRTLVMIDGPSHGGSEAADRLFTIGDCATAAGQVLDELALPGPVDWVGNAWGGSVGIVFAASQPSRVRSLVVLSTPITALAASDRRWILPLIGVYRLAGVIRPVRTGVVNALLSEETRREVPEAADLIVDVIRASDRKGMYITMRSVMLGRPDLTDQLPLITAPTVLATGEDDPLVTTQDLMAAAARLPHGQALTIPRIRHLPPMEAPEAVIASVTALWAATTPDPSFEPSLA